jgi:hypothetical protein
MKNPPEDLSLGHATAFILIYTSKYNDGEIKDNEFFMVLKSMTYWMGSDIYDDDLRKLLIETDEWFQSGSNFERLLTLDKLIEMIKNQTTGTPSVLTELFEDCIFICASNNSKYDSLFTNEKDSSYEVLLDELMNEFPLLNKLKAKLLG